MSEPTPFGRVSRKFTCPGLEMEQPDGVVPCYRAGHKCRTTWEELRDEHGIERRSFCGCCGDFQGAMGMPMSWIAEERDSLRAAVDAALAECDRFDGMYAPNGLNSAVGATTRAIRRALAAAAPTTTEEDTP